jgi:hypothetical protein
MTTAEATAEGLSDQPKGNNRVGLKVLRELDADTQAVVTLESNFSARTGAVGKDAGASGTGVSPLFDREANLRLISKTYGTLMLGRGPNMQTVRRIRRPPELEFRRPQGHRALCRLSQCQRHQPRRPDDPLHLTIA